MIDFFLMNILDSALMRVEFWWVKNNFKFVFFLTNSNTKQHRRYKKLNNLGRVVLNPK